MGSGMKLEEERMKHVIDMKYISIYDLLCKYLITIELKAHILVDGQ